ncbi:S1 RNA-binding domain-containing protein, partial [Butyricicoccus sp. 1XD8-22]
EHMANITLNRIDKGDTIVAVVSSVSPSLVRADIGGIEVKIPIEEIRYGWIDDLTEEVKVGDHFHVKVLEIDKEEKQVKVSRKALQQNPYPDCLKRYKKGNEYTGTVSGVREYGVFINLEDGVDSLARHLKYENVQKGDRVLVRIISTDAKKEHIVTRITRVI